MKVNANAVRVGNVIEHQKKLWRVIKMQHVMPGKGGAFQQMELKGLKDGTKMYERFAAKEDVEVCRLTQTAYTYLYHEGDSIAVMNQESYEQLSISLDLIGEQDAYLQDGMELMVETYDEEDSSDIVGITLPEHVTLAVSETEAVVKGQTAASSNKPAVMENGVRVMVPPFIGVGDRIVVKTEDGSYVERAKD